MDYVNLFLISLLYSSRASILIRGYNDYFFRDFTYRKPSLVEIINIIIIDPIFRNYIPYERKLYVIYV